MGFPADVPPGEHTVECFRPFLNYLIQLQLSRNTLRKHVNNLWALGGELILAGPFESTCRKFRRFLEQQAR